METRFSNISFEHSNMKIRSFSFNGDVLTLNCLNGFAPAKICFEGSFDFSPDDHILGSTIFGIRTELKDSLPKAFRIELSDSRIKFFDVIACNMTYIE